MENAKLEDRLISLVSIVVCSQPYSATWEQAGSQEWGFSQEMSGGRRESKSQGSEGI